MKDFDLNDGRKNERVNRETTPTQRGLVRKAIYSCLMHRAKTKERKINTELEKQHSLDELTSTKNKVIKARADLAASSTNVERIMGLTPKASINNFMFKVCNDIIEVSNFTNENLTKSLDEINKKIRVVEGHSEE